MNESRSRYSQQPLLRKDVNGLVVADVERCVARWAEYFSHLLNPNNDTLQEDDNDESPLQTVEPYVAEPTLQEVMDGILKLKNFKSPGIDNLPGELFKNSVVMYYGLNCRSLFNESGGGKKSRMNGNPVSFSPFTRKVTSWSVKIIEGLLF